MKVLTNQQLKSIAGGACNENVNISLECKTAVITAATLQVFKKIDNDTALDMLVGSCEYSEFSAFLDELENTSEKE